MRDGGVDRSGCSHAITDCRVQPINRAKSSNESAIGAKDSAWH